MMRRTETGGGYYERGIITPDPKNLFVLPISWTQHEPTDKSHEYSNTIMLNVTHKFNEHVSITSINRYIDVDAAQKYHHSNFGSLINADGVNDTITRHYREYPWYIKSFMSSTYVTVKVKTGTIGHSFVGGIDLGRYRYGFTEAAYHYNTRYTGVAPLNIYHPAYGQSNPANYTGFEFYGGQTVNDHYSGFYIQDFIDLHPKLKAVLGLRYDKFSNPTEAEYVYYENEGDYVYDPANVTVDKSSADAFVPRLGLVYLPVETVSVYGSYIQSFLPQYSNLPSAGGPFPPEHGEQWEFGAKGEFFGKRFIPAVAFYRIHNKNVLTPDPVDPNRQRVNGLARSRGIEISAQGEVVKGLNITGAYAYNESVTLKDADGNEGKMWFDNAPNHLANLWAVYTIQSGLLKGLKLGGGLNHVGKRYTSSDLEIVFPAYTLYDAMIGYSYKQYSLGLNFNNITDERYISGGWSRAMMLPGAPYNFKANLSARF
jgi:iron complex outermembrane receptor protein